MGCNVIEGRCRGVVRLSFQPKAAYLEGRCRGVVRLNLLPKAAYLEGRCRGVVLFRVPTNYQGRLIIIITILRKNEGLLSGAPT